MTARALVTNLPVFIEVQTSGVGPKSKENQAWGVRKVKSGRSDPLRFLLQLLHWFPTTQCPLLFQYMLKKYPQRSFTYPDWLLEITTMW